MEDSDHPAVTAVIALHAEVAAATVSADLPAFLRHIAPEFLVNSPGDRILNVDGVTKAFERGLIHYLCNDTCIERAVVRPNGEILLMGSETVVPLATTNVGRRVTYRFTEVWRAERAGWLLAIRQATITGIEPVDAG